MVECENIDTGRNEIFGKHEMLSFNNLHKIFDADTENRKLIGASKFFGCIVLTNRKRNEETRQQQTIATKKLKSI